MTASFPRETTLLPPGENFIDINPSPARVIIKPGALHSSIDQLVTLGDRFALLCSPTTRERISLTKGYLTETFFAFNGQASRHEIDRLTELVGKSSVDFLIGAGGGKALDVAKSVAYELRLPCVTIPTNAGTCAAWTSLAVLYDETGKFEKYHYLSRTPELLLIDTKIIANSPLRFSMAGLADTVAKYVETISAAGDEPKDFLGQYALHIAIQALAEWEKQLLLDTRCGHTEAMLNITLSGFSSGMGGMTAHATIAHALANGMTRHGYANKLLHGEMIAWTLLLQMILEDFDGKEQERILYLFQKANLPCSREEIDKRSGVYPDLEILTNMHKHATSKEETALLSPRRFSSSELIAATIELDRRVQEAHSSN
jgi:glycerol dehydrogenase